MDCQGAQEEPEGRPGRPEDLETAKRYAPWLLYLSLVLHAFLLAFPMLPGNLNTKSIRLLIFAGFY
jgi:hypothetical protein